MFCFQCEQTAKFSGENIYKIIVDGLFTTITNVSFNEKTERELIEQIKSFGISEAYEMNKIWNSQEDIRSLKSLILFGIRGMAAYAYHARVLGYESENVNKFFVKALAALGDDLGMNELLPLVIETGEVNLKCMELLDKANTETYGSPVPTKVSLTIEKGPFIVVTGHDLRDLEILLKQTEGKGINIYTHGEMLPAHAYPKLKKYKHLKGNFGTAWQNQQKEFDKIPAPVLFTTNCLMPLKTSYADRIFTTGVVSFPNAKHIGEDKIMTGINGGKNVMTGFGRETVLSVADKIIKAVKTGKIKHFFLVGGCDGARTGRNYYTNFVKQTPSNTIILTLACGKYRFNDLDLGTIDGLPRINELPLSIVLSWYEQKAVCVLLTLLSLGIKNIRLGPTLPAFVSPNVLKYLAENFNIAPTTTPEEDLAKLL